MVHILDIEIEGILPRALKFQSIHWKLATLEI